MSVLPSLLHLLLLATATLAHAAPALLVLTPAQQRQAGVQTAPPTASQGGATSAQAGGASLLLQGSVVAPPQAMELVSAPMAGVVQSVLVNNADAVRAGQAMLRLHSPALMSVQREFLQLRLQAEQADERLARDQRLADDGIIAAARLHETRNAAQQARLGALERRQALRLAGLSDGQIQHLVTTASVQPALSVPAAAAGRVAEVLVQPGQQVEAGAPLMRIARPVALGLALQATPAQAAQLRPGAAVQVQGCGLAGTVRGVAPAMQGSNQAVIVQVALARAADCVQANQVVSASVALPGADTGVQWLPVAALWQLSGQDHVFIAASGGFRPQPVTVLSRTGQQASVRGLAGDVHVVVAGVAALKGAWLGLGEIVPVAAPAASAVGAAPAARVATGGVR